MRVITAAADPHSFFSLIDPTFTSIMPNDQMYWQFTQKNDPYYGTSNNNVNNAVCLVGGSADAGWNTPYRPAKGFISDIQGESEIFCRTYILSGHRYYQDNGCPGDGRKLYKITNTSGKLLFSIGFNSSTSFFKGADVGNIYIFTYDDNGNVLTSQKCDWEPVKSYANLYALSIESFLSFHIKVDTVTPSNSFIKVYKDSVLVGSILGNLVNCNTNMVLKELRFRDNLTGYGNHNQTTFWITQYIVTNAADFSLQAYPIKPSALTANNQFSGVVGSIQGWCQDKNYINSPNEVNTKAEFTLTRPSMNGSAGLNLIQGLHKIKNISGYLFPRYVQADGTSVNIGVTVSNEVSTIIPQQVITVAANGDDNYYLTKKIFNSDVNLDVNDLTSIKTTVELLGV